jgi:hypothetical protein
MRTNTTTCEKFHESGQNVVIGRLVWTTIVGSESIYNDLVEDKTIQPDTDWV